MKKCVVCSSNATRTCLLCGVEFYCSANHQYSHWLSVHKSYCSGGATGQRGFSSLLTQKRTELRAKAASIFQDSDENELEPAAITNALAHALASLHIATNGRITSDPSSLGQAQLPDCVITAKVLEAAGDNSGSAFSGPSVHQLFLENLILSGQETRQSMSMQHLNVMN